MEISIGVQNVARELVLESDQTADDVAKAVRKAMDAGTALELTDTRGRRFIVPAGSVAYVEVGDEPRRVGFHTS